MKRKDVEINSVIVLGIGVSRPTYLRESARYPHVRIVRAVTEDAPVEIARRHIYGSTHSVTRVVDGFLVEEIKGDGSSDRPLWISGVSALPKGKTDKLGASCAPNVYGSFFHVEANAITRAQTKATYDAWREEKVRKDKYKQDRMKAWYAAKEASNEIGDELGEAMAAAGFTAKAYESVAYGTTDGQVKIALSLPDAEKLIALLRVAGASN